MLSSFDSLHYFADLEQQQRGLLKGCYSLVLGSQMRAKGLGIELGEAVRPWRRKVRFLGLILGLLRAFFRV